MDEQKPEQEPEQKPEQLDYRGMEPVRITTTIPAKGKRDKKIVVVTIIIGDPNTIMDGHPNIRRRSDVKPAQNPPNSATGTT